MTGLSVVFIDIYSWQIVAQPTSRMGNAAGLMMNILWVLFAVH
ncbi:hypothetical protein BMON_1604 [Bifidobacterium mongoliense DSM 21395]|uniref:Uncharacterized protein n=1 Tax=Bifidobacterium mongoliense DSM 21395 TaxID=1437603 RepID=A0A087BSD5_9BIFI|nr:hypothetical protein BMON_1604 [Bifidobacterium mongoliense DSM 21395]